MTWQVAHSHTFLDAYCIQALNRVVYDRHMKDLIFDYASDHRALHTDDLVDDLIDYYRTYQGVFIIGKGDENLQLAF